MNLFEASALIRHGFDFKPAGRGISHGDRRTDFRCPQPALGQPERIPAEAQPVQADQRRPENPHPDQHPAPKGQGPQKRQTPHGNTFRSSSKWGPSLRLVQSPPQTMAVP